MSAFQPVEKKAHAQLFYVQDKDPSLFDLVAVHQVKWQAEHVCSGYGAWAAFRAEVWHIHCEISVVLGCCPIDIQITVDPPLGIGFVWREYFTIK